MKMLEEEILLQDVELTLNTQAQLASVMREVGLVEEASNLCEGVLEKQTEILGEDHEDTVRTKYHLAVILMGMGKTKTMKKAM